MKIIGNDKVNVYVYRNDHPPPHCHVRLRNGSEISIDIPLIKPRYGQRITGEIKEIIEEHLDEICEAWDELHPKREPNN